MLVRFWGTRGSVPTPGPSTVRYGGNTSCIEVRAGETLGILDCGTGARALGASLAAQGGPVSAHLFITHYHWDHIQGFPFFLPAFLPHAELEVYGTAGMEQGLEEALAGQMQYTYFPVKLSELRSRLSFHEVGEGAFRAGDFAVSTRYMNHTAPSIGYRLTAGGATVALLTDHEPFWPHDPGSSLSDLLVHPADRRHVGFAEGADLLIHDSQYTAEEYPARRGWGHSPMEYVVDVAVAARVRKLAIFHHDPTRDDAALDALLERARERASARGGDLEIVMAAEGMSIELAESGAAVPTLPPLVATGAVAPSRLLILGNQERRHQLREILASEGYRLNEAPLDARLPDLAALDPDLVVVAPPPDGDVVGAVRAVARSVPGRPVIAILEEAGSQLALHQIGEVAADVVEVPLAGPNMRARVRACLERRQASSPRSPQAAASVGEALGVLDQLPAAELEPMLAAAARCGFRPGEVLFRQGDVSTGVYYLHSGVVRVVVETPDGREVPVGYGGPGDTIGEMSALDGAPRSASVLALEPVEASYISQDDFRDVLQRAPGAAMRVLELLTRRLRATDVRLAALSEHELAPPPDGADQDEATLLRQKLEHLQARLDQLGLTREHLEWYAQKSRPGTGGTSLQS